MKRTLLQVVATVFMLSCMTPMTAHAEAEFEWKASSAQVNTHPVLAKGFLPLVDLLAKQSNNRIHITYYNPNTLMPIKAHFDSLLKGLIEIANFGPSSELARFQVSQVVELPMMFKSAMSASLAPLELARTQKDIAKEWSVIKVATCTTSVPMDIVSIKPINKLEDLKGLRIACSNAPSIEQIKLLGGTPVLIMLSDMYLSLQRGMVDAILAPIPTYKSTKVCEVGKYLIRCGIAVSTAPFAISLKSYKKLPDDLKAVVEVSYSVALIAS